MFDHGSQRQRFEDAMEDSGLVRVPDSELPSNWNKMSPKQQTRWLHAYAQREAGITGGKPFRH